MSGTTIVPPDLINLIRNLPEDVQALIRELVLRGSAMSAKELLQLLIALLSAARNWEVIAGIVAWLARMGLIDGEVAIQAIAQSAEIVVEVQAAAPAGASVAAAGLSGAALAAVITALLAVILSAAAIGYELTRGLKLPPNGKPCGLANADGREMATLLRTIQVDAWGARRSLNQALEQAQIECAALAHKCHGKCPGGGKCAPTVATESVEQDGFGFFTRTTLTFACPCGCL